MVASGPSSNYDEADFNHGLLDYAVPDAGNEIWTGTSNFGTGVSRVRVLKNLFGR